MSRRTIAAAVAGVLAGAVGLGLLTGCSSEGATPAATRTVTATVTDPPASPSTPPSSTSTAAATPSGRPSTQSTSVPSTGAVDPDAPAGQCRDSALAVSVQYDPEAAGAGQRGAFVVFRNTGSSSCHLEGTPGLSLVGEHDGTQIGEPAQRITTGAKLVTIAPGKNALAAVQYTYVDKDGGNFSNGDSDPSCQAKAADGYRVYPPHSYRAYFSAAKTYGCSTAVHWITVSPVRPATDFKYFTPKS